MRCTNCHDACATHLSLRVNDSEGWQEVDVDLCDRCRSEFLDLDWIEERSGAAGGG